LLGSITSKKCHRIFQIYFKFIEQKINPVKYKIDAKKAQIWCKISRFRPIFKQKSRDFDLGFFDANLGCSKATLGAIYATKTLPR
jgi:hypothetical protein